MREEYNGGYRRRPLELIQNSIMHHAAFEPGGMTMQEVLQAILRHDMGQFWPGISYHVLYLPRTREVAWLGDWETVRYHADGKVWNPEYQCGQNNVEGVGICAVADYTLRDPDDQEIDDLRWVLAWIRGELGDKALKGHQEVAATACPGTNWTTWRAMLD